MRLYSWARRSASVAPPGRSAVAAVAAVSKSTIASVDVDAVS
jgi:hypothetical protein